MRRLLLLVLGGVLATVSLVAPLSQHASALGGSFDWVNRNYSGGALDDAAGSAMQSVSSDGRYVLFSSNATNVVPNDTNGHTDFFVRDRQTQTNTLVSVGPSGQQGNDDALAGYAAISGDGRYVVFSTRATNFNTPDNNGSTFDMYVRDIQAGTTALVCSSPYAGYDCDGASISRDGRYITYRLANPFAFSAQREIYRYDRTTGQNEIVSMDSQGYVANGISDVRTRMSADGRYVVFMANATNLVANDTNGKFDIFRKDMQTGDVALVSTTSTGVQANNDSEWPTISDDGRFVAFSSLASNFVANDTNANWDLYAKDMNVGTIQLVGGGFNLAAGSVTGDGTQVVFDTPYPGFTVNDTNSTVDVFSWNIATGVNTRLSEYPDGSEIGGGVSFGDTSIDGRYTLVYSGTALNPGDTNPSADLYVYDRHPAAPTNLTAASPTMKPVLNWSAVSGATSYKVYRNGTNVGSSTTPTYTDNTASDGTVSYYVTAVSGGGESGASNTVNVVVDTVRPVMNFTAPASFATPFTTGPTVTVTANDTGSGLQTLVIHVYTSANQLLNNCGTATPAQVSAGTMSCDLSSLPNGTYYIKAGSFDNAGNNRTINSGNFTINH